MVVHSFQRERKCGQTWAAAAGEDCSFFSGRLSEDEFNQLYMQCVRHGWRRVDAPYKLNNRHFKTCFFWNPANPLELQTDHMQEHWNQDFMENIKDIFISASSPVADGLPLVNCTSLLDFYRSDDILSDPKYWNADIAAAPQNWNGNLIFYCTDRVGADTSGKKSSRIWRRSVQATMAAWASFGIQTAIKRTQSAWSNSRLTIRDW